MKKRNRLSKYDVVISCSDADKAIADKIHRSMQKLKIDSYFYLDKNQLGENLNDITRNNYYSGANNALVLVSKNYVSGNWAQREWYALLQAKKEGRVEFIFMVKLDRTTLAHQNTADVYQMWNDNPDEIAGLIYDQLPWKKFTSTVRILILLLILGALAFTLFSYL